MGCSPTRSERRKEHDPERVAQAEAGGSDQEPVEERLQLFALGHQHRIAREALRCDGHSLRVRHHHRHIVWTENNARFGSYEWHQLGAGHVRDAVYCDGTKWNNGFIIANVDTQTESVAFDYTYVGDTFAVSGGTWYYREPGEFYPALEKELDFRRNGG